MAAFNKEKLYFVMSEQYSGEFSMSNQWKTSSLRKILCFTDAIFGAPFGTIRDEVSV